MGARGAILASVVLCTVLSGAPRHAAAGMTTSGTVKETLQAGPYTMRLQIGPLENMYTAAEVKAKHPRDGELMVRGTMVMGGMDMGGTMPNHHLELKVVRKATGTVVTSGMVSIRVTTPTGKLLQQVPIAVMYDLKVGPSDTHFGNNISLKSGHYHVTAQVDHTSAKFDIMLGGGMSM